MKRTLSKDTLGSMRHLGPIWVTRTPPSLHWLLPGYPPHLLPGSEAAGGMWPCRVCGLMVSPRYPVTTLSGVTEQALRGFSISPLYLSGCPSPGLPVWVLSRAEEGQVVWICTWAGIFSQPGSPWGSCPLSPPMLLRLPACK